MTQPALDYFKKRSLLLKKETTEGVDASPVGSTDGFRLFDGSSSTEFDKVERPIDRDFFGGEEFAVANRRAKIEGEFELYPPATPGQTSTSDADCARVLLPAGMAVTKDAMAKTTTYSPVSAGIESATACFYHTGTLIKSLGSRVDVSSLAIAIGDRMKGNASITGTYEEVTGATPGTVVLPSTVPVVARHKNTKTVVSTLVKGGTSSTVATPLVDLEVWAKSLSIDFGNALQHKEYTSKAVNGITDRQPTWSLQLAKTDISADFNPWFVRDNGIILTAALTLWDDDTRDGLKSTLFVRGQIESITPTDIDGDYGWELSGPCIPSSSGNDEFYIEFGDDTP